VKDFNLPKIKSGFSPQKVGSQKFPLLKDMRPISHEKALKGGHSIGFGSIKNPLAK